MQRENTEVRLSSEVKAESRNSINSFQSAKPEHQTAAQEALVEEEDWKSIVEESFDDEDVELQC